MYETRNLKDYTNPKTQFGEECFYCFEKKNILFLFASLHREFFQKIFRWNNFVSVAKNTCCVSIETFWGKTLFWEKTCSLSVLDFGPFFCHYSIFLADSSKLHSKSRSAIRRKFFWKGFFCYFWAWSKNNWSFVGKFWAGLPNFMLPVHRNCLRNNLFFGKK